MGKESYDLAERHETVTDHLSGPLGIAVGACAIGFIAGLMLPTSDTERRALRPVRDRIEEQSRRTDHKNAS
ncbi:MAG: hypothetical protein ACREMP_00095 [Candidatus Tyrphobacter sp.]